MEDDQIWSYSILVVFHFGRLPFWSSSILIVFHFSCLPFWSSSIFGRLPFLFVFHFCSFSNLVIFHFGRLPFWSSSILVVFHSRFWLTSDHITTPNLYLSPIFFPSSPHFHSLHVTRIFSVKRPQIYFDLLHSSQVGPYLRTWVLKTDRLITEG